MDDIFERSPIGNDGCGAYEPVAYISPTTRQCKPSGRHHPRRVTMAGNRPAAYKSWSGYSSMLARMLGTRIGVLPSALSTYTIQLALIRQQQLKS